MPKWLKAALSTHANITCFAAHCVPSSKNHAGLPVQCHVLRWGKEGAGFWRVCFEDTHCLVPFSVPITDGEMRWGLVRGTKAFISAQMDWAHPVHNLGAYVGRPAVWEGGKGGRWICLRGWDIEAAWSQIQPAPCYSSLAALGLCDLGQVI